MVNKILLEICSQEPRDFSRGRFSSDDLIGLFTDAGTALYKFGAIGGGVPATLAAMTAGFISLNTALNMLKSSSLNKSFGVTFTDLRKPEMTGCSLGNIVRNHSKEAA